MGSPCRPCAEEERRVACKDAYPLPRIDEALDHIAGSSWFCSLDLRIPSIASLTSTRHSSGRRSVQKPLPDSERLSRRPLYWRIQTVHRPFIVDTDTSNVGVGAVLSQEDSDGERAVTYYSGALSRAQRNYCMTRRELLAVVKAQRYFRPYLQGSHFRLRTDHASLTWLLNFKHSESQVAWWLEELQECHFQIEHRAGQHHTNADALSHHPCAELGCGHCHRQEEKSQLELEVAAVHTISEAASVTRAAAGGSGG
ncbi:hypothetical protein AAFF_G00051100 [Aldrovandia affinis]|uniref:Reverse transcriptase RNase H-like domain-containing protein n=1 Tax=Aldrovandia affinis TaxID=143900 RepID=A0AAD7WZ15_9TELE|nr:hypothetical protein AAFF_G00051100 [Aldrovandia affinis]